MGTLYLIRHGSTKANEQRLYCGSTDLPLSEAGIESLKKLKYRVPEDCLFVTSGMQRTAQTLRYLFGEVPFQIDERFREIDFGVFEMKSYEQLKGRDDYQRWISNDHENNIPPGGESGAGMRRRVIEGLGELQKEPRDVVLITHGGVIAAIMSHLFPLEMKNRYQWQPEPGHGYRIMDGRYQPAPFTDSIG